MYLTSALLGAVVGAAGTVVGGMLAMLFGKRETLSRPLMSFAGGMMIAVVFFDMLIESTHLGGMLAMCSGGIAGGVFFALLSPLLSDPPSIFKRNQKVLHKANQQMHSMYSIGVLVLVGIAMHNLPEGLAVGSSLVESERLAFTLALLMLVHNIPEGMAVCLPLRLSGMSVAKILGLAFLTGLPTAVGAVIGTAVGSISSHMIGLCIAFAGGAMLYISLKELIPAAGQKKGLMPALLGLSLGFIMTTVI